MGVGKNFDIKQLAEIIKQIEGGDFTAINGIIQDIQAGQLDLDATFNNVPDDYYFISLILALQAQGAWETIQNLAEAMVEIKRFDYLVAMAQYNAGTDASKPYNAVSQYQSALEHYVSQAHTPDNQRAAEILIKNVAINFNRTPGLLSRAVSRASLDVVLELLASNTDLNEAEIAKALLVLAEKGKWEAIIAIAKKRDTNFSDQLGYTNILEMVLEQLEKKPQEEILRKAATALIDAGANLGRIEEEWSNAETLTSSSRKELINSIIEGVLVPKDYWGTEIEKNNLSLLKPMKVAAEGGHWPLVIRFASQLNPNKIQQALSSFNDVLFTEIFELALAADLEEAYKILNMQYQLVVVPTENATTKAANVEIFQKNVREFLTTIVIENNMGLLQTFLTEHQAHLDLILPLAQRTHLTQQAAELEQWQCVEVLLPHIPKNDVPDVLIAAVMRNTEENTENAVVSAAQARAEAAAKARAKAAIKARVEAAVAESEAWAKAVVAKSEKGKTWVEVVRGSKKSEPWVEEVARAEAGINAVARAEAGINAVARAEAEINAVARAETEAKDRIIEKYSKNYSLIGNLEGQTAYQQAIEDKNWDDLFKMSQAMNAQLHGTAPTQVFEQVYDTFSKLSDTNPGVQSNILHGINSDTLPFALYVIDKNKKLGADLKATLKFMLTTEANTTGANKQDFLSERFNKVDIFQKEAREAFIKELEAMFDKLKTYKKDHKPDPLWAVAMRLQAFNALLAKVKISSATSKQKQTVLKDFAKGKFFADHRKEDSLAANLGLKTETAKQLENLAKEKDLSPGKMEQKQKEADRKLEAELAKLRPNSPKLR